MIKGGEELGMQRDATTVKRVNGTMKVFDGPFIESKETVGRAASRAPSSLGCIGIQPSLVLMRELRLAPSSSLGCRE